MNLALSQNAPSQLPALVRANRGPRPSKPVLASRTPDRGAAVSADPRRCDPPAPAPASMATEEEAMLARLLAGDESAFEQLVREQGGRLLACAQRLLRSEEDARDVVQQAFLLAFRSLPRFEGRSRLSTWLHRIVTNLALMKLRSRKRRPEAAIEDLLPSFSSDGALVAGLEEHVELSPLAMLQREETRAMVRRCIDLLPTSHRAVLLLRDVEDRSTEQVAETLGIRTGAVKVRLHRARQALKTLLEREMAGGGPL